MKALKVLLLALVFAVTGHAQVSSGSISNDSPKVAITDVSWSKEVFIPALYEDPMLVNQAQRDLERDQKATIKANADRVRQGKDPLPIPGKPIAANVPVGSTPMGTPIGDEPAGNRNLPAQTDPGAASVRYVYKARITNQAEKTILSVLWTYSLFDSETKAQVGQHRFRSRVNVGAGKTGNLVARSKTPPTTIIQAAKPQTPKTKYDERVTIDRIEYNDGTSWNRPQATAPAQP